MKTLKNDWLIWLILIAPFPIILFFWSKFPEQVPTHFNIKGEPDDYSGKVFGLFVIPVVNFLLYFAFLLFPKIDPSGKNYSLFIDKYKIIRTIFHAFMFYAFLMIILFSLGYLLDITQFLTYGVILLMLVLGNYLGNIRHNYFIGVRTPWTLANEEVWKSTHRFTAKLWVSVSILMILILPFVPVKTSTYFLFAYISIISLIPVIFSYLEYRKEMRKV